MDVRYLTRQRLSETTGSTFFVGRLLQLFAAVALFFVIDVAPLHAAQLKTIHYDSSAHATVVTLELDAPVHFVRHDLPATDHLSPRCYLDLQSTQPDKMLPWQRHVGDERLENIRLGVHGKTLRIVFDLQQPLSCQVLSTPNSPMIVLQFSHQSSDGLVPEVPDASVALDALPASTDKEPAASVVQQPSVSDPFFSVEPIEDVAASQGPFLAVSTWGELQGYTAYDVDSQGAEDDDFYRFQARFGADLEKAFSQQPLHGRVTVEVDRLYYDAEAADEDTDVTLYEAYLSLNRPQWDLSVGKQRVRWGKSDQLSPLDCINPEDLRQFVTIDLEDRKEPSWLVRLRTYGKVVSFEAIVSPWFEESEIDYFDSNWALYRNLRQSILTHPALSSAARAYAGDLRVHEEKPSDSLENMSGAFRMSWQTDQADYALSYRYGWETLPTIVSFPVKNIRYDGDPETDPIALLGSAVLTDEAVEARFRRQKVVGAEWETTFDLIGFRGEVAYIDKVAFLTSELISSRHEVGQLVTGIDYTSETEWYFNVQTSWLHIFHYDKELLYFDEDTVALLGELRKSLWRGNLDIATRFNYTLSDGSSYVQPNLTLKYFPNTECELGVNIFSGDGETWLGSYDQADQVYAKLNIVF